MRKFFRKGTGYRVQGTIIILFIAFLSTVHYPLSTVHAQLEVSDVYDITDTQAVDGDLVSYTDKGLVRSDREYDNRLFGVVQTNPSVSYRRVDGTGTPVTRSGTVFVNVTTINGPIKVGDLITSSNMAGKGEKAENSGYVIGFATKEFKDGEGTQVQYTANNGAINRQVWVGQIPVAIKIEFAELNTARSTNRLLEAVNQAFFRNVSDPEQFVNIVRYILAGLAVLLSFVIGFFTFARSIPKGIEALGRNPLARASIQFGIIINIIFTVGIALIGIVAAVILLRF